MRTVRNADKIVVMKKGKIVEQGTHQQLIKDNEVYAKLVRQQEEAEDTVKDE